VYRFGESGWRFEKRSFHVMSKVLKSDFRTCWKLPVSPLTFVKTRGLDLIGSGSMDKSDESIVPIHARKLELFWSLVISQVGAEEWLQDLLKKASFI
jgi:hypothetical protein